MEEQARRDEEAAAAREAREREARDLAAAARGAFSYTGPHTTASAW